MYRDEREKSNARESTGRSFGIFSAPEDRNVEDAPMKLQFAELLLIVLGIAGFAVGG